MEILGSQTMADINRLVSETMSPLWTSILKREQGNDIYNPKWKQSSVGHSEKRSQEQILMICKSFNPSYFTLHYQLTSHQKRKVE